MVVGFGRSALVACLIGTAACGLVFSPGEYRESPEISPGPGPGPASVNDGSVDSPDAPSDPFVSEDAGDAGDEGGTDAGSDEDASTPTGSPILVIGGQRPPGVGDPNPVFVAESLRTALLPSGALAPWSNDVAPPVGAAWTRAMLDNGSLFLQKDTTVYKASFADHVTGAWTALTPPSGATETAQLPWLFPVGLVSAGGIGGFIFVATTKNAFAAPFNFGTSSTEAWRGIAAKLVKARAEVTLFRHGGFVYAIGGRENQASASGSAEVEVAPLGGDGLPGTFATTQRLFNPSTQAAQPVVTPIVTSGGGYLFVIGGSATSPGAPTDVVLAAKIDEATGALGAWVAAPKFPTTIASAAALVVDDRLFVFGGTVPTGMSDAVTALSILPAGGFGAAWSRVGSLPGPRSGLVAVRP
jgi:hypothetical protein